MSNQMSLASRKTVWLLRLAYFITLVGMAIVCTNNYRDNAAHTLAVKDLVELTHSFQELALLAETVNSSAIYLENTLIRSLPNGPALDQRRQTIVTTRQIVQSKMEDGLAKTEKLQVLFELHSDDAVPLHFNSHTHDKILAALNNYAKFFRGSHFSDAESEAPLINQIGNLLWDYKTSVLRSRDFIRKSILEHHEFLGVVGNELHSKFIMITASILLVIGLMIFLPADIIISRLIQGFEMKRREAEIALKDAKQADRAKSEFLATMSHEIRTPMNGVLGMAELLNKTNLDDRQKTFSNVILKSSNALLCIINDILDFSKIDAQQLQLQDEVCNVGELVGEIATLLATKANEKDVELVMRIQPDMPKSVLVDGVRLRQVIINILGNAIKFTEKGHVLINVSSFECDKEGSARLRFVIEDTGIGISEDQIECIFDKFSQVDSSNTRRFEGTGLGLAISARLVDMMGGKISVTSELGVGSKFVFSLDLPIEDEDSFEEISNIEHNGQARALVVDDNDVNRAILLEQLSSWGYDCVAVESGATALEFLNTAQNQHGIKIDIVVLDYQMPEMTGAEVLKEIRSIEAIADTNVLLLSSVDQSDLIKSLKAYELDGHLTKPARGHQLKAAIDHILTRSHVTKLRAVAHDLAEPSAQSNEHVSVEVADEPGLIDEQQSIRSQEAGLDILVCEDNEVNQLVISQYLEMTDYSFKIVGNGKLGVSEWEASKPRLILMDVSMPEMNGREATRRIREIELERGISKTPIIGVTAHAQIRDRQECLESGMDDVLTKPLSSDALIVMLGNWMISNDLKKIASSA